VSLVPRAPTLPADPLAKQVNDVLRGLEAGLYAPEVGIRLGSIDAAELLGSAARPLAPRLIRLLAHPDRYGRWAAARVLGGLEAAEPQAAVPALVRLLCDPDLDVRITTVNTLARYGPEARGAVPSLAQMIGRGDPEIRIAVIDALGSIGT